MPELVGLVLFGRADGFSGKFGGFLSITPEFEGFGSCTVAEECLVFSSVWTTLILWSLAGLALFKSVGGAKMFDFVG